MKTSKRVFVIGAGVSAEYGLPLAGKLTELLLDENNDVIAPEYSPYFTSSLQKLFPKYRRGQTSPPSLFEFISLYRSRLDLVRYLWPENVKEQSDWGPFYNAIKKGLARYFVQEKKSLKDVKKIDLLIDFCRSLQPGDVIISFNWDCLMEMALEKAGVPWGTFLPVIDPASDFEWPREKIYLLKLHGSIDWIGKPPLASKGYYSGGRERAVSDDINLFRLINPEQTMDFDETNIPALHIPGEEIEKSEFGREIKLIWKVALAFLLKASGVTIIGYSMPFYDLAVRNLFLLSCAKNRQTEEGLKIEVVNPDLQLKLIYESVFGEPLFYFDVTFGDWVSNVLRYKKLEKTLEPQ